MAIVLGRNCTVSVNGTVAGVRSVTADETASEFEFTPYGSRNAVTYTTATSQGITVESIDDSAASLFGGLVGSGAECTVSGTGFAFSGVVTSVNENQNIDGVRTITATIKKTYSGLR